MKITSLGHAGLFIETVQGSILCDPWFNPAFYGSWFPFPDNSDALQTPGLLQPDFLFVSHMHEDHFDRTFLERVGKRALVILPDYPLPLLENELRGLGFHRFLRTTSGEPLAFGRLTLTCFAAASPLDGPVGDSCLVISDGETTVLNQNDSRPQRIDAVNEAGPFDVHFLQHSGAVWYPQVYDFPKRRLDALVRLKRKNQHQRALHYIRAFGAEHVVPNSGPPCFLDPDLWHLNDFYGDTIFPDVTEFLPKVDNGLLVMPGETLEATGKRLEHLNFVTAKCFGPGKEQYLRSYAWRKTLQLDWKAGLVYDTDATLRDALERWLTPLVRDAGDIGYGVGGLVVISTEKGLDVALDFARGEVRDWDGSPYQLRLTFEHALLADVVARRTENWPDDVFLSCRFKAERPGPYNDFAYAFLRSLSPERLAWAKRWLLAHNPPIGTFWAGSKRVQKNCPHMGADLEALGTIDGDVLTCTNHGWQFDLNTGLCLNMQGVRIYVEDDPDGLRRQDHRHEAV